MRSRLILKALTAAGVALCCAISPALAVSYAVRNAVRLTRTGTAPAFASTWTVTVFENGAIATANSTGTTITVASGHGFTTGDKLMVGTTTSTYRTVASTSATSVVVNSAVTVTTGAFLVNLGADTGVASPSYDGSTVSIYQYSDGTGAYSGSHVTLDSQGRYGYWVDNSLTVMELFRNSAGAPDSVQFVSVAGGGGSSSTGNTTTSGCAVDGTVMRLDGTSGTALTCSNATLADDGKLTIAQSATPVAAGSGGMSGLKIASSDGANNSTDITYTNGTQFDITPLYFDPTYRIKNDAGTIYYKGIHLRQRNLTGDFDHFYGIYNEIVPAATNSYGGGTNKSFKASIDLYPNATELVLDGQTDSVTFPDISGYWLFVGDDSGSGTSNWKATDVAGYRWEDGGNSGYWNGSATLTNVYGFRFDNQITAGANIVNQWGGYLGAPLLLEDNSAGGAALDRQGYIAWATDAHSWLQTSSDVSGDGTADASDGVNARFRWNNDTPEFEFDIAQTTRWKMSRSGSVSTFACGTTDDKCRLSGMDATLGETYAEVDNNSATPTFHTNLGVKSDASTSLVNGLNDIAANDNSQTPACTAGTACFYDKDSSASDNWGWMNGTTPATINMGVLELEGATDDAFETLVTPEEPMRDSTVTVPMATGYLPVALFSQVTAVTVNTAASTTLVSTTAALGTPTLPATYFNKVGKGFVVNAWGIFTTDGSPGTAAWKLQIGSVDVLTGTTATLPTSFTNKGWHLEAQCFAVSIGSGTSATVRCQGGVTYQGVSGSSAGAFLDLPSSAASSGFDSTATQLVDIEVNPSGASGDTFTMTNFLMTSIF